MYKLTKLGTFTLKFKKGNKCGGEKGSSEFSYVFVVETGGGGKLDKRGFVVEHVEVSADIEQWAKHTKFAGSCEQVVDALMVILQKHVQLKSAKMSMSVTRTGNATIERVEWRYGK